VADGDFCFVAGTTGYDYATMTMPEGAADQARNAFRTIAKVLGEAGFGSADVVRATYYYCVTNCAALNALRWMRGSTGIVTGA
jgi:enamine deaminase RidA (YjgF/YER057c/UK114 family)